MKKERWFKCFPSKWLNALGGLSTDEGYLYIVVCFRIYDTDGPCRDSVDALVIRTNMTRYRVRRALNRLLKMKKLFRTNNGLMNAVCADVIDERRQLSKVRAEVSATYWKKAQQKQQNDEANG